MRNLLLDTNVVSEIMRDQPSPVVLNWFMQNNNETQFSCAVTKAEILSGVALLPEGKRKQALAKDAELTFTEDFPNACLPFDAECANYYAFVVASRKAAGKAIGTADAQIAAIALANDLTLVTRNTKDFEGITGLNLINPWLAPG